MRQKMDCQQKGAHRKLLQRRKYDDKNDAAYEGPKIASGGAPPVGQVDDILLILPLHHVSAMKPGYIRSLQKEAGHNAHIYITAHNLWDICYYCDKEGTQ